MWRCEHPLGLHLPSRLVPVFLFPPPICLHQRLLLIASCIHFTDHTRESINRVTLHAIFPSSLPFVIAYDSRTTPCEAIISLLASIFLDSFCTSPCDFQMAKQPAIATTLCHFGICVVSLSDNYCSSQSAPNNQVSGFMSLASGDRR